MNGSCIARAMAAGVALMVAGLLFSASGVRVAAHEADGHPARIQRGSCANLGGVAFQLTGVGASATSEGTPVAALETVGSKEAFPVQISETTLDTGLSDLTRKEYAIVVYESDEAMDRVIACGNIGGPATSQMAGMVMPGDELAIGLGEVNGSGYAGVALLRAEGGTATLRLFLAEGLSGNGGGHDDAEEPGGEATPAA